LQSRFGVASYNYPRAQSSQKIAKNSLSVGMILHDHNRDMTKGVGRNHTNESPSEVLEVRFLA